MDRRNFMRSLIGGVAATAAVRAFPFRVFSFPSQPKLIQFGDGINFARLPDNTFNYGGVPLLIDELCPPGKVYDMSRLVTLYKTDVKVCHPQTLHNLLATMKCTRIEGITI